MYLPNIHVSFNYSFAPSESNLSERFDDLQLGFVSSTPSTPPSTSMWSSTPPPPPPQSSSTPTPFDDFRELQRLEDEKLERLEDLESRCVFVEKHSNMTLLLLCDGEIAQNEKAIFAISKIGELTF